MLITVVSFGQTNDLDAKTIIRKADEKLKGKSSQGKMEMTIIRPDWQRTLSMKVWTLGVDYSLIYITAPAKEKGQVFLKRKRDMWNWMPTIERMIKIPPSMMMQSWMGSDFTNDDLVNQSSIVKDYTHTLLGEDTIRGQVCYKIELIPKEDAPVVWGKIITWITVDGLNQWKSEYYDEDDYLINTENCYDLKWMGDREIPSRYEIIPEEEPGQKTVLKFVDMVFNKEIKEGFFSQQNMKRIK
jgi:outer membrane lipoprotein-sorting protein